MGKKMDIEKMRRLWLSDSLRMPLLIRYDEVATPTYSRCDRLSISSQSMVQAATDVSLVANMPLLCCKLSVFQLQWQTPNSM